MKARFEILVEMKDTSELMIDLAYSALLFNNRALAKKVHSLESYTDHLYTKLIEDALGNCSKDQKEGAMILIRLATGIEALADCAKEIADVVLRDIEPHPILKKSIQESDTGIFLEKINNDSLLANGPLGKTGIAQEMGIWVVAIQRGNKWIVGPHEKTFLNAGDILIGRGPTGSQKKFHKLAKGTLQEL